MFSYIFLKTGISKILLCLLKTRNILKTVSYIYSRKIPVYGC